jgi:hypothetical protein
MTRRIDTTESQLAEIAPQRTELATVPATPEAMLQTAMASNMDPASMEKFYALFERMKAAQAKAEFHKALTAFKEECPPIPRSTVNAFFKKVDRDGVERPTMYASLEDIAGTIKPHLAKHGLSTRWGDSSVKDGMLTLSCIVSHVGGHSESSACVMPVESKAGSSPQQKYGVAETYAMRRSLARALGLTDCEEDTDGNGSGDSGETVTADMAANLEAAVLSVNGDAKKFLQLLKAERFIDIPLSKYGYALAKIEEKRKGGK